MLQKIAIIYSQDRQTEHLTGSDRVRARHERVKPYLDDLKTYLEGLAPQYLKKGAMRTAIGYALNNWHKFTAFLDHAEMPLDNNTMEHGYTPVHHNRKNWLFAGSPRGAHASAFIYSMIETAKANDLEPKAYLKALFEQYPLASDDDQRRQLLPWNFKFKE